MRVFFLGDFFYDFDFISQDIKKISEYIKEENLHTVLNLEGTLFPSKYKIKKRGPNLCSNSENIIQSLKLMNTKGVCLANNHIMDFGENSLLKSIELLNENDIQTSGAGKNIENASIPIVLEGRIAVINFGWDVEETVYAKKNKPGCLPRDEKFILKKIKEYKLKYEKVIVYIHWGFEYNRFPMPFDIDLAHKMIDAGADIIIGSHPHCVQAKEKYKDKMIYYSLGNFYFSSRRKRFSNKVFNEEVKNQSDYGIGVIVDTDTFDMREILIKYDYKTDISEISMEDMSKVLKDITGEDFKSKKYLKMVKNNKKNINPILTTSKIWNAYKLIKLYVIYFVKKCVKSLLRK